MEWLNVIVDFARYVLIALVVYGLLFMLERLRPAQSHQPLQHLWFNLQWYLFYTFVSFCLRGVNLESMIQLVTRWVNGPYINLVAQPRGFPENVPGILLYFLLVDFFYYWFHRLQHHHPFLWDLHKFHHSDVSLNVTSTQRVHWLEEPCILVFIMLPMTLMFRIEPLDLGLLALIELLWLQFIHMNLRVSFGVFAPMLVGPQHHRIHHSTRAAHLDKNFALFFPLWDIVFGTYCRPQKDEFPETGLTTGETYTALWPAIAWSFRIVSRVGKPTGR